MIQGIQKNRFALLLIILAVALALQQRIVFSTHVPLNVDESKLIEEMRAMHGLPVHFIGYGWGENVLLAYIAYPFVAVGIDPLSILRVIVCIASIITMLLTAYLARRWFGDAIALVSLFISALWPWSVASGGVGFNVFVAFPLFMGAGILFERSMHSRRLAQAVAAGALIGIACYGYALYFIWAFFFFIGSFFVSRQKKYLNGWWYMLAVFTLTAFPLMLFYAKNSFGFAIPDSIWLLQFPALTASRFGNIVISGSMIQKIGAFTWNYLSHFNFFLLAVALFSHRYGSYFTFAWDPFLIYIALWRLLAMKKMPPVLAWWLLVYPIGSSLTRVDGIFALTRDIIGMPVLIILTSVGIVFLGKTLSEYLKKFIPLRAQKV